MKKLYTSNHINITTCGDFEVKFKNYLNYLKLINIPLFNLFINSKDFKIENLTIFREEFNVFFETWLRQNFNNNLILKTENIDSLIITINTTDERFNELFANYNFYKKINSAKDTFYIYDITIDEDIKYKKIITDKPLQ